MFDNTNPYTIRIEETNGQKRYFVAFIDGQGIFRESEVSYEVYTQFCRFVKCERNLRRSDERHLEQSELTEETLCRRPVLVISNDIGNKHSPTVIIAAITSRVRKKKKLPTHLYLGQIEGLPANSIILFEQLRTIDKSRLKEHLTHLDEKYLKSLEFPLLISIGVEKRRSL